MIVVAGPRCGGTIFCLDKAKETNLEFVGEIQYRYFQSNFLKNSNWKKEFHETGYQETLTIERCVEVIENPHRFIVLVNGDDIPTHMHVADYILLRKNLLDVVKSIIKFFSKFTEDMTTTELKRITYRMLHNYSYILEYCHYKNINPLWYEDLYEPIENNYTEDLIKEANMLLDYYLKINPRIEKILLKRTGMYELYGN